MATLTVQIDKVKDLPALQSLLNRLGLQYTIKDDETAINPPYKLLSEEESRQNLLDHAIQSFKEGWDTDDKEEEEYWNSFLK